MSLLLGTYEIDITPELPIPLAGFAHREGNALEVHSPLFLKAYYFEKENHAFLLMVGDVIWWDDRFVQKWRKRLADEYSLRPQAICFHATHNHSGPQTSDAFTSLLGEAEPSFLDSLEAKIVKSVEYAIANKEQVTIARRQTTSEIGVYRRLKHENKILMRPNPSVPINKEVTIITFKNEKKETNAMLIHFSCHPTSTDANVVSAEYTGVCCSLLKKTYPHAVIGFLQGCCGDVRPALIKEDEFYRGSLHDMETIGNQLAMDILSGGDEETIVCHQLQSKSIKLPLYFQENYIENEDIDPEVLEIWKKHSRKSETLLEIQYFKISPELHFIFFNGEMVQGYGEYIKSLNPRVLALGYSNGMIGYIPTQIQLMEGGYEAEEFIYYFGLPAPFHIKTEKEIQNAIENILEGEWKMTVKRSGHKDKLAYYVFETRNEMGEYAARDVANQIVKLQQEQEEIRMVFAAAPSQNEFLQHLISDDRIHWNQIIAFHMDEYVGLDKEAPQLFQNFLKERLFHKVPFKEVHLIDSSNENELERYSKLLEEQPIDIVCLGIGENGHIAFNDPPVADFHDQKVIKKVELDAMCRQQQVNDGCFASLEEVPSHAWTLTIPTLLSGKSMYCIVPGSTKRQAIYQTLNGPISTECPASILRTHEHAYLYVDQDSFGDE